MVIFPLAPDQTIAQMRSNGARGGRYRRGKSCYGIIRLAVNTPNISWSLVNRIKSWNIRWPCSLKQNETSKNMPLLLLLLANFTADLRSQKNNTLS